MSSKQVCTTLLKCTRQHAIPVGQIIYRISCSDDEVEGTLSTISESVHGSKHYWSKRNGELLRMFKEFGSLTFFLTLTDSPEIDSYLRLNVNSCSSHRKTE